MVDGLCVGGAGGEATLVDFVGRVGGHAWRMEWIKWSICEVGEGRMDRLLWSGMGGAGVAMGRFEEPSVDVSWVGVHALAEEVVTVGGTGGGMSWRNRRMISWVESLGLSWTGVDEGDWSSCRCGERERESGLEFVSSGAW